MKNYALVWTNLTKFVCQNDKEKTFGTFKLLANFLDNKAHVLQLEGDLLLFFFQKKQAIDCYVKAAQIYIKQNKFMQAVAIYNHICTLDPKEIKYILKLTKLLFDLNNKIKIKNNLFLLKMVLESQREKISKVDLHKSVEQMLKESEITDDKFFKFIFQFINTVQ